jgi:hypothetical protein
VPRPELYEPIAFGFGQTLSRHHVQPKFPGRESLIVDALGSGSVDVRNSDNGSRGRGTNLRRFAVPLNSVLKPFGVPIADPVKDDSSERFFRPSSERLTDQMIHGTHRRFAAMKPAEKIDVSVTRPGTGVGRPNYGHAVDHCAVGLNISVIGAAVPALRGPRKPQDARMVVRRL